MYSEKKNPSKKKNKNTERVCLIDKETCKHKKKQKKEQRKEALIGFNGFFSTPLFVILLFLSINC